MIDVVQPILAAADIKIKGDRPWDITVHNERFYKRGPPKKLFNVSSFLESLSLSMMVSTGSSSSPA
jgi:hypothetical protein